MLKTAAYPKGLPKEVFDQIRATVITDREQFFKELSASFYGANRAGAKVSQGLCDSFWLQAMPGTYVPTCLTNSISPLRHRCLALPC